MERLLYTRREHLRSLLLAASALVVTRSEAAMAGDDVGDGQAEWAQRYDDGPGQAVRDGTPTLSTAAAAATSAAIDRYRAIAAAGGWGMVPAAELRVGSKGQAVLALRRRLAATGDLGPAAGFSAVFDAYVEAAVERFQARHGLGATGELSTDTVAALNVPAEVRLRQLEVNLVRLRSFSGDLGPRFVMANIPAASVETVEDGSVFSRHVAGVGKVDRQSPVMQTRATDINFNPYWHVPASIVRKDLIPKMQADPDYLRDNHIHVYDKGDVEVVPESIDWRSNDGTKFRYREDP